ncbi:Holliday junction resolvase RusA-like endonuclease [Brevibacterium sanguinis]|uniref:Holliday junction resolvase RusA-like endonuclease n=2 Tax=Brevibacterium TaxID=1696 RepID=A0A366IME5_9MICO|nr:MULTISPECIES: RusA family crossover junction endodeoxyribonuclease [Brevibacterium]RBP66389.1 Holliday junction resolvase RusA-like endonuclease [Brevibacterium sanguinis]RBP73041.1 Holliday junction resolvase RusA-like endonuclease [Brevibacterium celere]
MTEYLLDIWVPGRPVPQGSLSRNRAGVTYQKKSLVDWRNLINQAAADYTGTWFGEWAPLDEPVEVIGRFYLPRPKSATRVHPTVSPDVDKLARGLLDALAPKRNRKIADGSFLADDSRVIRLDVTKTYAHGLPGDGEVPGVRVKVRKYE